MPEIELEPSDYRPAGTPKPSWWARLNAKPKDWDKPSNRIARWSSAIIMGLILMWVKSHH